VTLKRGRMEACNILPSPADLQALRGAIFDYALSGLKRSPSATRRPPSLRAPKATPAMTVAFLGLGAMGRPMAARLIQSRSPAFAVRVYNRSARGGVATGLTKLGGSPFTTPRECATGADVVVTMLSDAEALANVLEGPQGVLKAFASEQRRPRPVLVDMSTIGRSAAVSAARRVDDSGGRFVDAPVSGSVAPAGNGELVALVGGSVTAVERARPVLATLCKRIIHAGPVGHGQALKVILNGIGA